tara:strand:- start:2019 stop:2306 length:288 start_codon:yes stop_codon:yes gene_type:complete
MFESIYWPLEITMVFIYSNQFPTLHPKRFLLFVELIFKAGNVLPLMHKAMLWRTVYEFSKVEKKIVDRHEVKPSMTNVYRRSPLPDLNWGHPGVC